MHRDERITINSRYNISHLQIFFLANKKMAAPQKIHINPNFFLFYNDRQVVYYTQDHRLVVGHTKKKSPYVLLYKMYFFKKIVNITKNSDQK